MSTLLTLNLILVHACACDFCSQFEFNNDGMFEKRERERESERERKRESESGEDYPPSLAPNLVQEKLEGIALALNSSMYSNIVAA